MSEDTGNAVASVHLVRITSPADLRTDSGRADIVTRAAVDAGCVVEGQTFRIVD
jgi:hypothetical protein